ncbi:MAG: XRE family transcriptional regulator [Clostridia bacterium]|nr:XRE family transcriptional regulator [Clostridia bacterium]
MDLRTQRLKTLVENSGMTQSEICEKTGINKGALSSYLSGRYFPKQKTLEKLSNLFNVSINYLMGLTVEPDFPLPKNSIPVKVGTRKIPVLGRIAAGQPIEAVEEIIDYVYIDENLNGDFIALKIDGDSMSPKIPDGATVIIRLQENAETNDIVAVYINGYDATCKKLRKLEKGGIVLISLNPTYEPMAYTNDEIEALPIKIIGKVVEVRTKV